MRPSARARAALARAKPYEDAAAALIATSGCQVRSYRATLSGVAYTRSDDWWIEVPAPRGPVAFAVFAHEVGHQLLHRGNSKPRWLEELEAWEFALDCFPRFGLKGLETARRAAARSLRYAAEKARRRASDATKKAIDERYPAWVWFYRG